MINAVTTSKTECCLMNMVDNIIERLKTKEEAWSHFLPDKPFVFISARCAPKELYTWMLGHKFVGVSVL